LFQKQPKKLASAFISNCNANSGRDKVVLDLQNYGVSVDSFGKCNRNAQTTEHKLHVIARYKFHLAFENSLTDDYVTEKYFGCLEAGTVPVYIGAPNIRKYEPYPHSIIVASDFKTTKALADYLLYLDKNQTAYDEYLYWKRNGLLQPSFRALIDIGSS